MIFHYSYPQNSFFVSWNIQIQTWQILKSLGWCRTDPDVLGGAVWWTGHFRQKYFSFQDKMLWKTFFVVCLHFFLIPLRQQRSFHGKGTPLVIFEKNRVVIFDSFVQIGTLFSPSLPPLYACIAGLWLSHLFHRSVIIHFLGGFLLFVFKLEIGKRIKIFSCYSVSVNSAAEIQMRPRLSFLVRPVKYTDKKCLYMLNIR